MWASGLLEVWYESEYCPSRNTAPEESKADVASEGYG